MYDFIFGSIHPCIQLFPHFGTFVIFIFMQNSIHRFSVLSICKYHAIFFCLCPNTVHSSYKTIPKASADVRNSIFTSVNILKSIVEVKMSRQQRLQAEVESSTPDGSFDLEGLLASPGQNEDIESDSAPSYEEEVEAATTAAFSGDLNLNTDDASANFQQPADPSSSSALPPLVIQTSSIAGVNNRRVKLRRPGEDVPNANSSPGSSALPSPPCRIFTPDFGRPASAEARLLLQERLEVVNQGNGGRDHSSTVDGGEVRREEEGMDTEEVVVEREETPVDPEVDKDSPMVRIQRKQARWFYHRNDLPNESESVIFKAFSRLTLCCNKEKEMRSSAIQCGMGFETLERRQGGPSVEEKPDGNSICRCSRNTTSGN